MLVPLLVTFRVWRLALISSLVLLLPLALLVRSVCVAVLPQCLSTVDVSCTTGALPAGSAAAPHADVNQDPEVCAHAPRAPDAGGYAAAARDAPGVAARALGARPGHVAGHRYLRSSRRRTRSVSAWCPLDAYTTCLESSTSYCLAFGDGH
ncbi:unnamed protein product [Prorocentrum cordatum]|uniref:Secreted protein n=1 Tax=Prorocentrum cordatum TaxID=2364126 RepID=A0ABN9SSB9_9DINO|nr:unnamed protein product [Polarella glacialis]